MIRATTNGVLMGYRNNLMKSFMTLNQARNTVLTQRNFNSFAEDPSAATQAFQLRRAFMRTSSQYTVSNSVVRKYEVAWSALDSIEKSVDSQQNNSAFAAILAGMNEATGSGRNAVGKELTQLADSIVQTMNNKYGENYTFAGADGLNVPFEWRENAAGEKELYYRGIPVDSDGRDPVGNPQGAENLEKLDYLSGETTYVDIGFGLQEDADGNLIESSAFNSSLVGINYLGYGVDEDGDPKNIASIISRMGQILTNCSEDGTWASDAEKEEFARLAGKFEDASAELKKNYTELDTKATFLKQNDLQLKTTASTLNEQFLSLEQVDLADAITSYSWAQYCYNASLKVGNSILSQSLMDYLS